MTTTTWKPGAHITVAALRKIDACEETIVRLVERWPAGAALTLENLIEAEKLGADISWLAEHILSARAWAAYNAVCAPALTACNAVCATAWASCEAARARARAAYEAACAPALTAYNAVCAPALWFAIGGSHD